MRNTLLAAGLLLLTSAGIPTALARTEVVTVRWDELSGTVANRTVTVVLSGGGRLTGVISQVRQDDLLMAIDKSSDHGHYPPGEMPVPRREITEIRLKRRKGPGRLIGAGGAGAATALGALPWAISDARVNVSDGARIAQWAALTAGATAGGYLIGRLIDTRETVIRLAPDH